MKNKSISISILIIILITAGAYLFENIAKVYGVKSATIIKCTQNDEEIAFISAEVLKQLMEKNEKSDEDSIFKGPSLILTVNAIGAGNFKGIEVKGKGENSSIYLDKNDINDDLKIVLVNDGTMNLFKKGSSSDFLVKEINEISFKK